MTNLRAIMAILDAMTAILNNAPKAPCVDFSREKAECGEDAPREVRYDMSQQAQPQPITGDEEIQRIAEDTIIARYLKLIKDEPDAYRNQPLESPKRRLIEEYIRFIDAAAARRQLALSIWPK